jgi:hypothetical protein
MKISQASIKILLGSRRQGVLNEAGNEEPSLLTSGIGSRLRFGLHAILLPPAE